MAHERNIETTSIEPPSVTSMTDVAPFSIVIIGGGPGGLFAARHLAGKVGLSCKVTVFEASDRLGGEIETKEFAGVGPYEAGVAEIYDYSRIGPDPLHDLIVDELGLQIRTIRGGPCVLDDKIVLETNDLARLFGNQARDEAVAFRKRCADLLSPEAYYLAVREHDNAHPWSALRGHELLEEQFRDDVARRYIRAMAHSDVAAEPHQTNGLTFLKNVLMDVDGYIDVVSVVGGNEQIVTRLAEELDPRFRPPRAFERKRQPFGDPRRRGSGRSAQIRLNANVTAVEPLANGKYRLDMQVNGIEETVTADYVVVAVPLSALSTIHWRSESLEFAMERHAGFFDRPGSYLRATFLFRSPFWREKLSTDWWMSDAFDGCCIYDEGSRNNYGPYGVLAFLIAGNAALELANQSDEVIEQMCLDALPTELAHGKELLLDRRIHRWMATVSAIPGGLPVRRRRENHQPDAIHAPGIVKVGDYLFDATLNGVMDSAEVASDIILADVMTRRRRQREQEDVAAIPDATALNRVLERVGELMSVQSVVGILNAMWDLKPGATLLHFGAGAGHMVSALRAAGFDATGVECSRSLSSATPGDLTQHNRWCEFTHLPFKNRQFDAVIETGLYRTASKDLDRTISELYRVTKNGLLLGSVTTDLTVELIERFDLLAEVQVLCSRWDWAEKLYAAGFVHALFDPLRLGNAWERVKSAGVGPGSWYEDSESLLYCVYERPLNVSLSDLEKTLALDARRLDGDLVSAKPSQAAQQMST